MTGSYRPARVRVALGLGAGAVAFFWALLGLLDRSARTLPPLPWAAAVATAALAAVVVAFGLPVRRWVRGERTTRLDPLVAMRTLVLAKAAAYGGALLAGWYAAQGLVLLPDLVGDRLTRLVVAGLAALAAVAVCVAGFVVQRWCELPPDDETRPPGAGADR